MSPSRYMGIAGKSDRGKNVGRRGVAFIDLMIEADANACPLRQVRPAIAHDTNAAVEHLAGKFGIAHAGIHINEAALWIWRNRAA